MIVMSADLDVMYSCFLNNQLHPYGKKVSFTSLKTLGSWVRDLCYRVAFMRTWLENGQPAAFPSTRVLPPRIYDCLIADFWPGGKTEAIDGLSFEYEILRNGLQPELITEAPEDGVIVFGLYLEGA